MKFENEMDEEFHLHLQDRADALEKSGMTRAEAERRARLEFGGDQKFREQCREAAGTHLLETIRQDLRFALRVLAKSPGFAAVAILTLALGIGANTAIFSVVHAVLLRALPYREPDRLVKIWGQFTRDGMPQLSFSDPEWFELSDTNHAFEQVAAYYAGSGANLGSDDTSPQRITRGYSTAALFPLLGVQPILGRTYSADEDQPGHSGVVVISYQLWQSLFAGDVHTAGKSIRLNGRPFTVVGVLPAGFDFAGNPQVWQPLGLNRTGASANRGAHSWQVIGRLKPNWTISQAATDMTQFAEQLARENPTFYRPDMGWGVTVTPLREELVGQIRPALRILSAAVAFVLLIACANVANLLLARGSAREKEMAVRTSLGASRWRTIRQLLTESLLLSLIGAAVGLALGDLGMLAIRKIHANVLPTVGKVELDTSALLFTFAITLFAGLLFGLAPAWRISQPDLQSMMKEGARGSSSGRGHRMRNALVVAEIAFSVMLVAGAGLAIRSFYSLTRVNPGFRTDHILTMRLSLPNVTYPAGAAETQFYQRVLGKLRALPGVQSAGAISQLPMGAAYSSGSVFIESSRAEGLHLIPGIPYGYLETDQRFATPGYFESMKTPLVSGRLFSDADTADATKVAIVDSKFATDMWPGDNPIGKRVAINTTTSTPPQPIWCTVVGVVTHVHNYTLDVEGRVQAYFPQTQDPFDGSRAMFFAIRTTSDPSSIASAARAEMQSVDRSLPAYDVHTMDEVLGTSLDQPRLSLELLGLFAALAALLAAIGVYGVMAFGISQRRHELGIRVALGARAGDLQRMVIGQGARLALAGVTIGVAGALYLARYMAPLLYGIGTRDPITFAVVPFLLMAVALTASWIPAIRASRVDPIVTLRHE